VDTNHCGLPWPVDLYGYIYCGCVHIIQTGKLHDAIDGHELTNEEIENRKGNINYDYDDRMDSNNKRPKREMNAIQQSISDRCSFVNSI
jgi:hypothetical protein